MTYKYGETIAETANYELKISDQPVTEQFSRHWKVFHVVCKKYGTVQSEMVFSPQAMQALAYTQRLHDECEAGLVDMVEGGLGAETPKGAADLPRHWGGDDGEDDIH